MSFAPAVSLTEQIADHIGKQIISGELAPKARIQELKVAGDLGVSRGSVREALLILQRRHLIEIMPRRGAVVSTLSSRDIANFCQLFTDLEVSFFGKLASLAVLDRRDFLKALEAMTAAVAEQDRSQLLSARAAFLNAGFEQLEDFYLCSVLAGLIPTAQRLAHRVSDHPAYDPRDTLRYHQALLQALEHHDAARTEELVRAFNRREAKLALGCNDAAGPGGDAKLEKTEVFSIDSGRK